MGTIPIMQSDLERSITGVLRSLPFSPDSTRDVMVQWSARNLAASVELLQVGELIAAARERRAPRTTRQSLYARTFELLDTAARADTYHGECVREVYFELTLYCATCGVESREGTEK